MKKTIFSIMFAMILGTVLVSCANKNAVAVGTEVDSTLVDSVAVDSAVVDTMGQAIVTDSVCKD